MARNRGRSVTSAAALWDRRADAQTYEQQITKTLERVSDLVAYVRDEHFDVETLQRFWRGEPRARGTVQTIGRLLGRPLVEELDAIREALERALAYDLLEFSREVAPNLFEVVDQIYPLTPALDDRRARVEQFHYAVDVRQAVLQHVLTTITQRYQMPRFREFAEASLWTEAYSANLQAAQQVIAGSRELLRDEVAAVKEYLQRISVDIEGIEAAAEARFGLVKRVRWVTTLEEAEHEINNVLAERATTMENVAFAILKEARSPNILAMVARQTLDKAPKLGMLLLGLAGSSLLARGAQELEVPKLSSLRAQPQRGSADPADTARMASLTTSKSIAIGTGSAAVVDQAVDRLVGNAQQRDLAVDQGSAARLRVDGFFDRLGTEPGRQTFVIQSRDELVTLLDRLANYGYRQEAVLDLLGLASVDAFTHPLTLDMREGTRQPILFPSAPEAQATAALPAVGRVEAVYQIRPGDSLSEVAERHGIALQTLLAANPSIYDANSVRAGDLVTLPGRAPRAQIEQLRVGASLSEVASLFNVDEFELATLNEIYHPSAWQYSGETLRVPAPTMVGGATASSRALGASQTTGSYTPLEQTAPAPAIPVAPGPEVVAPPAPVEAPTTLDVGAPEPEVVTPPAVVAPGTGESFIVYRVQPGETLAEIASRYGTTIEQVAQDNRLMDATVQRGQNLLIRRPSAEPGASLAAPTGTVVRDEVYNPNYESSGSFGTATTSDERRGASGAMSIRGALFNLTDSDGSATHPVVARYGDTLFTDLDAMPEDARAYLVGTVEEVGAFFDVRPGDILGILKVEQNDAGWKLNESRRSTSGAVGVGQIVPRTWNGWASPVHDRHARSMLEIEEHGGLGFDWAARDAWLAWQEGRADRSVLENSNADPTVFENNVAAVARHLVHWGLTNDFAERDPAGYAERLADAIAVYNSGSTLDVSADWVQSAENHMTTAQYVSKAMETAESVGKVVAQPSVNVAAPDALVRLDENFRHLYDMTFGVKLTSGESKEMLAGNPTLLEDVRNGKLDPRSASTTRLEQVIQHYITEGREAIRTSAPRPWPYIHNYDTLYAQKNAVNLLGRTLTLVEIDDLMHRTRADREAIRHQLTVRGDSKLFQHAKARYDQLLERSARGKPLYNHEVAQLLQPLLAGHSPYQMSDEILGGLVEEIDVAIESLDEYRQLHGNFEFEAVPLLPMPEVFKDFGVSVDYQVGGRHTGIDLANPAGPDGSEPPIYAVDDATVVHVGPLYCEIPDACRGGKAIVLDHGNDIYSIYSHNSEATVSVGEAVRAGQRIGRQGNEGFSYGSHLHFEVHVGAPFSGDWERPFTGGNFVDPMKFLPGS